MNFLRYFLFPISIVYYVFTFIRNFLYDNSLLKSYLIPVKSICIGNLSMGGTGKSPTTIFLIEKLIQSKKIETLSRGYGRKTKGYLKLNKDSIASEVGDEPLMFYNRFKNFKNLGVHVCESRTEGVKQILKKSNPDLIILDDAFQHRKVKAGFSILITEYNKLFCDDFVLPLGNLRESSQGKNRADVIIVSKSPHNLSDDEKQQIKEKLKFNKDNIFFSSIKYEELISFSACETTEIQQVLLVTGIANPTSFYEELNKKYLVETLKFSDHHNFSSEDMQRINKKFDTFVNDKKAIVTSEKDFSRLVAPEFLTFINERPWYYQKISITLDRENEFLEKINTYLSL